MLKVEDREQIAAVAGRVKLLLAEQEMLLDLVPGLVGQRQKGLDRQDVDGGQIGEHRCSERPRLRSNSGI